MPLWLIIILIVLTTHRVTRIITRDSIPLIAIPRDLFVQRWGGYVDAKTKEERKLSLTDGKTTNIIMKSLAYLWECDWCTSVYVATGVTLLARTYTSLNDQHWFISVLVALTASSITGLIAQREPS